MACILKFCELHYDWAFTSESSFCSVVWLSWCASYRLIFWFRLFLKTPVTCMWDIWWPIGLTAKASLIFVIYLLFKQNFNIASFYMVLNMFNTLGKKGIFFSSYYTLEAVLFYLQGKWVNTNFEHRKGASWRIYTNNSLGGAFIEYSIQIPHFYFLLIEVTFSLCWYVFLICCLFLLVSINLLIPQKSINLLILVLEKEHDLFIGAIKNMILFCRTFSTL